MIVSERAHTVPVLIAGAGPAGLMAAVALARHGVRSMIVERRPDLSGLPRATAISLRSMELLRSWGLEDEIRAGGIGVEWQGWVCDTLAAASAGSAMGLGLPTREQSALISPTTPACVPQDHLEPVLLRHLRSFDTARPAMGTELLRVENDPDGVRAELRDVRSGETRVVHARYLVAADGAHSTVRGDLGIPMHGPDNLGQAVAVLFRAPLWDLLGEHRYGFYDINHPDAGGIFLPAGPTDRWVYGLLRERGHPDLEDISQEAMTRRMRLASGDAKLQPQIERIGSFTFAAQLAARFRQHSAFLVGDAAHRVTPRGGTGMNTAIHDGYDLGWKLAWVLRGWGEPQLLDSYETERRPVAMHNATRSADADGTLRGAAHQLHADLGGRIAHVWLTTQAGLVSTLDLLGDGLTLFTGPDQAAWRTAADRVSGPLPLAVRTLDVITARSLGIRRGGALLCRPDGSAVGWWPDHDNATTVLCGAVASARAGGSALSEREVA